MEAIKTEALTKVYGTHQVLAGINLTIQQGQIFTLLGENGAGKSTLIQILTTLVRPSTGEAWIFGKHLSADADEIRHLISVTNQAVTLDEEFTGYQNLRLLAQLVEVDNYTQRIESVSERLNLGEFLHQKVGTYSGGMKRRLDIAASLLTDTPLLFLDEPTTGVDPKNRIEIWRVIEGLREEGKTIFLTTQYLEEADHLSDTIAFLKNGKISLQGTPTQLKQQAHESHQISVTPDSAEKARMILENQSILFKQDQQLFEVEKSDLQRVLKLFVEVDVAVLEILPVQRSLEEIFLDATRKDAK